VLDAIAAGQLQATGALQDYGARLPGGRALAVIDIVDDISLTRYRQAPPVKSRSTPSTSTMFRCCVAYCCG